MVKQLAFKRLISAGNVRPITEAMFPLLEAALQLGYSKPASYLNHNCFFQTNNFII